MKHADKIDMSFKYTPARLTDVTKTFARILRHLLADARESLGNIGQAGWRVFEAHVYFVCVLHGVSFGG